jgi:hypothetical protein
VLPAAGIEVSDLSLLDVTAVDFTLNPPLPA